MKAAVPILPLGHKAHERGERRLGETKHLVPASRATVSPRRAWVARSWWPPSSHPSCRQHRAGLRASCASSCSGCPKSGQLTATRPAVVRPHAPPAVEDWRSHGDSCGGGLWRQRPPERLWLGRRAHARALPRGISYPSSCARSREAGLYSLGRANSPATAGGFAPKGSHRAHLPFEYTAAVCDASVPLHSCGQAGFAFTVAVPDRRPALVLCPCQSLRIPASVS